VLEYFEGDYTMHNCETYTVACLCCDMKNPAEHL